MADQNSEMLKSLLITVNLVNFHYITFVHSHFPQLPLSFNMHFNDIPHIALHVLQTTGKFSQTLVGICHSYREGHLLGLHE